MYSTASPPPRVTVSTAFGPRRARPRLAEREDPRRPDPETGAGVSLRGRWGRTRPLGPRPGTCSGDRPPNPAPQPSCPLLLRHTRFFFLSDVPDRPDRTGSWMEGKDQPGSLCSILRSWSTVDTPAKKAGSNPACARHVHVCSVCAPYCNSVVCMHVRDSAKKRVPPEPRLVSERDGLLHGVQHRSSYRGPTPRRVTHAGEDAVSVTAAQAIDISQLPRAYCTVLSTLL